LPRARIRQLKVRSASGDMIPLSALLNIRQSAGPERAIRYNGFLSSDINAAAAPGYSSGQAQAAAERIAAEVLPPGFAFEWTDLTYQGFIAGNSGIWVFPLAILLVFLAALYESMTLPLSIIMIVPMGCLLRCSASGSRRATITSSPRSG
jgi:multidrug efflux pump